MDAQNLPAQASPTPSLLSGPQEEDGILAAYVWDASPFLDPRRCKEELSLLERHGFNRVLLSLDPDQISRATRDPSPVRAFLAQAAKRKIAVELLLGEPSWILPEHRQDLKNITDSLSAFNFSGLHLDMEPYQLPDYERRKAEYAAMTAQALNDAADFSPWPVSFSLHPMYLTAKGGYTGFKDRLRADRFSYVAVMAYITDMPELQAVWNNVLHANPDLHLVLAQSVELDQPGNISLAGLGLPGVMAFLQTMRTATKSVNFQGFAIQSWEFFRTLDRTERQKVALR